MNWCAICGSQTHKWNSEKHTDEEQYEYVQKLLNESARRRSAELRWAYNLIAKDIKKRPRNILKLTKRLQKLRGK